MKASVDEAMVAYTGQLGFKQYVPLMPILNEESRFGCEQIQITGMSTTTKCTQEKKEMSHRKVSVNV